VFDEFVADSFDIERGFLQSAVHCLCEVDGARFAKDREL
jgi:hypothetical protein